MSTRGERIKQTGELLRHYFGPLGRSDADSVAASIVDTLFPNQGWSPTRYPSGDCSVTLLSLAEGRTIQTVKALRAVAELSLKEAKDVCDRVRAGCAEEVLRDVSDEYAQHAKNLINAAGGSVKIDNKEAS